LPDTKGKEFTFGGLVIGAEHRTAQNGNGWGILTIEDFSGSVQLRLFKDDYLKWKHFFVTGTFLYIKAKTMPNYKNPETSEIKATQIMLLSEVRDKMAKSLTIRIPLNYISDDVVKNIYTMTNTHPGKCTLKVTLFDPDENMSVDLASKKIKLNLTNELLQQLDTMTNVSYKLN
jgi:DNA polymerase-3 subunit alpha